MGSGNRKNTGLKLNIAVNYGGRAELVRAAQEIATLVRNGTIREQEITELEQRVEESREFDAVSRRKRDELKSTAALIEKILTEPRISDANLRLLLRMVYVHQNEDKSLDVRFEFNGDFAASYVTWMDTEQTA